MKKLTIFVFAVLALLNSALISQEVTPLDENNIIYDEPGYKHYGGLFLGANSIFEDSNTGFKIGLNYEFTKSESYLGIGFYSEFIFGSAFEFLLGAPIYFHDLPIKNLNFSLNPAVAFVRSFKYYYPNSNADPNELTADELEFKNNVFRANFVLRFGASYDFSVYGDNKPWFFISPTISFDILSYKKLYFMYGVNFIIKMDKYVLHK